MHVSSIASTLSLDPDQNNWNWVLRFLSTAFILALGFVYLLRSTASKYFIVDANFDSSSSSSEMAVANSNSAVDACANCGNPTSKQCAGCKLVKYWYLDVGLANLLQDITAAALHAESISFLVHETLLSHNIQYALLFSGLMLVVDGELQVVLPLRDIIMNFCFVLLIPSSSQTCQSKHWRLGHKTKCQEYKLLKHSGKHKMSVTLVPSSGPDKTQKVVDKVLFPYDEFVKLYDWDKPIFPPCGLLNCGNSCYANVVLQCLAHTRPLLGYLLDKGHRRDCRRNGWCFLCELETHLTRASRNPQPYSPLNILSRLPSIGGNLGYGKQEDAHEFMRFAIDTMQSVCLDEHGGEKLIDPKSQETTLIQHIFGGQLRSQVICTKCNQISNQYENMMDLMVEIQGDATSLQQCLDQFTAKEWLHGENMYKCDGCKDYVSAWKHLTIHQAPNILTITLKRFQSGRFGKINKKIIFPENLDLSPYMSEVRDGMDRYKLYAVIVHVDMLNASYFGHYICYTKGFQGDWYRIDDCKVARVELEEVLSQGAYMLLYRRISARPKCLKTFGTAVNEQQNGEKVYTGAESSSSIQLVNSSNSLESSSSNCNSPYPAYDVNGQLNHPQTTEAPLSRVNGDRNGVSCALAVAGAEVPDISGSSSLGVNALNDTSHQGSSSATAVMYDKEAVNVSVVGISGSIGKHEEHKLGDESHAARDAERYVAATIDQTAAPCELGLGKEQSEANSAELEVENVELNASDGWSNDVIDDMIVDQAPTQTYLDFRG
ncbi:Ubiquitin carboxyl-terminal hydrolase 19 [Bienertia sinuspersici]